MEMGALGFAAEPERRLALLLAALPVLFRFGGSRRGHPGCPGRGLRHAAVHLQVFFNVLNLSSLASAVGADAP